MPLNNYSLLLHHNASSLGIHRTMFETKCHCKYVESTMMQNALFTYITSTIFDYHYCWNFERQKIFKFKTPTLQVWKLQNHLDAAVLIEDFSMVSRVRPQFPKNLHSNSPRNLEVNFIKY